MNDNSINSQKTLLEELRRDLDTLSRKFHKYAYEEPENSLSDARKIGEAICNYLMDHPTSVLDANEKMPPDLSGKIQKLLNKKRIPETMQPHISTILLCGNYGSHYRQISPPQDLVEITHVALKTFINWFCQTYGLEMITPPSLSMANPAVNLLQRTMLDTMDFFERVRENPSNIECVCMAFHAGPEWLTSSDKAALINFLVANHIPLKVILNNSNTINNICVHMRQPMREYKNINECIRSWKNRQRQHPDLIQVRVSKLPLIHRTYLVKNKDASGAANIKYYTYANGITKNDPRMFFDSADPEYQLYTDEFEYLWNLAAPTVP